jgi:hypothetical protein
VFFVVSLALTVWGAFAKLNMLWFHAMPLVLNVIGMSLTLTSTHFYFVRSRLRLYGRLEKLCIAIQFPCAIKTSRIRWFMRLAVGGLFLYAAFGVASTVLVSSRNILEGIRIVFMIAFWTGVISTTRGIQKIQDHAEVTLDALESNTPHYMDIRPPSSAKFLLLLVPRRYRENLIGDLEEEYATIVAPQFGLEKARLWYWWQVLASLTPLLWAEIKRFAGLILLWKSVR